MTNKVTLIESAKKLAYAYSIAEEGSQRKADMLRRYEVVVVKLGFDPLV